MARDPNALDLAVSLYEDQMSGLKSARAAAKPRRALAQMRADIDASARDLVFMAAIYDVTRNELFDALKRLHPAAHKALGDMDAIDVLHKFWPEPGDDQ